jgi:2-phospho-L-lactate/phosphoenolpyruvate guanylyltransferase
MSTLAIVPVKRFALAKQRLGSALGPAARRRLAEAMVGDVLDALAHSRFVDATLVVTREPIAAELARASGAAVLADLREKGQSAAAELGIKQALRERRARVLLVPGDCPALDPLELDELLALPPQDEREVVVIPDRHGTGTNGLLLTPPDMIRPSFGPGSFERHRLRAAFANVSCEVARPESLLLDVDTRDDLETLSSALGRLPGGAERTRALLERLAVVGAAR